MAALVPRIERSCVPHCTMQLYFRAALTACRPSQRYCDAGFSTYTCLPAWHDQIVPKQCQ